MYYSTKIFTSAGVGVKDAFASSVMVGLVNLLFTFVAVAFVDHVGRAFPAAHRVGVCRS